MTKKLHRVIYSDGMISFAENSANFTKSIVTRDETWCFQSDPEIKREVLPAEPKFQKTRQAALKIKTIQIDSYNTKGLVQGECLSMGQMVTAVFYRQFLQH